MHEIDYLIIGYGNTLRGDDGVGHYVAEAVALWNFENVRSRFVHQLTPELAAEIALVKTVIFVDAIAVTSEQAALVRIDRLQPTPDPEPMGHHANPQNLLNLTATLFDSQPTAYHVLIPAIQFEFSETLSPRTQQAMKAALEIIKDMVLCHIPRRDFSLSDAEAQDRGISFINRTSTI